MNNKTIAYSFYKNTTKHLWRQENSAVKRIKIIHIDDKPQTVPVQRRLGAKTLDGGNMFNTRCRPQLASLLKYDEAPYTVSPPHAVEAQCEWGDRSLCGQSLFAVRLDMALSGLMAEFGDDFFQTDIFPSRLTAAADILTAARVFLDAPQKGREKQEKIVRLLAEEAETVLSQWVQHTDAVSKKSLLRAAEEGAVLF